MGSIILMLVICEHRCLCSCLHLVVFRLQIFLGVLFFLVMNGIIFLISFSDGLLLRIEMPQVFVVDFVSCNFTEFISSDNFRGIFMVFCM